MGESGTQQARQLSLEVFYPAVVIVHLLPFFCCWQLWLRDYIRSHFGLGFFVRIGYCEEDASFQGFGLLSKPEITILYLNIWLHSGWYDDIGRVIKKHLEVINMKKRLLGKAHGVHFQSPLPHYAYFKHLSLRLLAIFMLDCHHLFGSAHKKSCSFPSNGFFCFLFGYWAYKWTSRQREWASLKHCASFILPNFN